MKVKTFLTSDNWTQRALARDNCGNAVSIFNEEACKFCLLGAISRIYPPHQLEDIGMRLRDVIRLKTNYTSISLFNDNSEFSEIKRILNIADI